MRDLLVAAGVTVAAMGCGTESIPEYGSTAGISYEEFRAKVPRESGTGFYVVDWDLVLPTEDELFEFWASMERGALTIYNTGVDIKWNDTQKLNLTYCIGASFGANKPAIIAAMEAATTNGWEKFAKVNFVYLADQDANCNAANPNVVFDVNQVSGQPYLARAFFPNFARNARNVLVDTSSYNPQATGGIPLANILGHELGHALGFRHEHILPQANDPECVEDNQYRQLTPYDSASVMHYPQCNGTGNLAFTLRDQEGAALVYGPPVVNVAPMTQLVSPVDGQTVSPSFTVLASVVDTDLASAALFIDGALDQSLDAAPFEFAIEELSVGTHTLRLVGTDTGGLSAETTITVEVVGQNDQTDPSAEPDGPFDDPGSTTNEVVGGCSATQGSAALPLAMFGMVAIRSRRRTARVRG